MSSWEKRLFRPFADFVTGLFLDIKLFVSFGNYFVKMSHFPDYANLFIVNCKKIRVLMA